MCILKNKNKLYTLFLCYTSSTPQPVLINSFFLLVFLELPNPHENPPFTLYNHRLRALEAEHLTTQLTTLTTLTTHSQVRQLSRDFRRHFNDHPHQYGPSHLPPEQQGQPDGECALHWHPGVHQAPPQLRTHQHLQVEDAQAGTPKRLCPPRWSL